MAQDYESVALARLEDQITWYDRKSGSNERMFKMLKCWTILMAAAVPVLVAVGWNDARVVALLTATIAVAEGLQQLNQHHTNWILYRATCESLKHEKYLYLAHAGPYATAANRTTLLAERIEGLVSQEHARWTSGREESTRKQISGELQTPVR